MFDLAECWISNGFSVKRILGILGLNRSTYYARRKSEEAKEPSKRGRPIPGFSTHKDGHKVPDAQIEEYLMEYSHDDDIGALGYQKWTVLLKAQYGLSINKKKVIRMCRELNILKDRRTKKAKHPRKLARNRIVTEANQLWQVDIKYGNIEDTNYFVFVCCAIDVFDRKIVGFHRGSTCRAKNITKMLTEALVRQNVHFKDGEFEDKLIIRTDNGPQFVSELFGDFCEEQKIHHERIPKKTPNMNAFIESFHSRLQAECFDRHIFSFYDEAYYYIDQYIEFYNKVRPHGSLLNYPPDKYGQLVSAGTLTAKTVSL